MGPWAAGARPSQASLGGGLLYTWALEEGDIGDVDRLYSIHPLMPSYGESPWLTATVPMDKPYCSCKLTRVRTRCRADASAHPGRDAQPRATLHVPAVGGH